jgi:hypothetical protein
MSSSTVYSLHYLNGRGRAEAIRLIFAQAGQKLEDLRHNNNEWTKLKSQMPLGQVPVLGRFIKLILSIDFISKISSRI